MRPSRRVVLAGGLAAATGAGVAVPLTLGGGGGKLLPELLASRPFYVAHRGGSADWPECSMEAYARSVDAGVDALEIPVARSADGVWFGLHDATLDRTSGTTGFVAAEHTWAEISRYRTRPPGPATAEPHHSPTSGSRPSSPRTPPPTRSSWIPRSSTPSTAPSCWP